LARSAGRSAARRKAPQHSHGTVVVIGLGRFGKSLALELMEQGTEVLGVDSDHRIVQSLAGRLTHVVQADATNEDAMRQLSVAEFERAVIGVGNDLEASILSASVALGLGVDQVWAKAISHAHARILTQIGVHHVVRPEHDMGKRVAHLVKGSMLDYIEIDDGYAIVKTRPPRRLDQARRGRLHLRDGRDRDRGRRRPDRRGTARERRAVQRDQVKTPQHTIVPVQSVGGESSRPPRG
jgi:trk system potassium uptake protein TrkA